MEMERTSTSYACRSLLLGRLTKRLAWRRHRIRFLAVEEGATLKLHIFPMSSIFVISSHSLFVPRLVTDILERARTKRISNQASPSRAS